MDVMGRGQRGQEVLGAYLQVDKANHIKKVEKARLPTGERTTNNEPPLALRALAPANGMYCWISSGKVERDYCLSHLLTVLAQKSDFIAHPTRP